MINNPETREIEETAQEVVPKNIAADRTQLREVEVVDNTTIEAFSGLSCFGIPALRDTNPQVFPGFRSRFHFK